jgi:hypothetical protein
VERTNDPFPTGSRPETGLPSLASVYAFASSDEGVSGKSRQPFSQGDPRNRSIQGMDRESTSGTPAQFSGSEGRASAVIPTRHSATTGNGAATDRYSSSGTREAEDHPTTSTRWESYLSPFTPGTAFTPETRGGLSHLLSPAASVPTREPPAQEYLLHSHAHRQKFLGASSNQIIVKWLDELGAGVQQPSTNLKHGMTPSEEMLVDGQGEVSSFPLPEKGDCAAYVTSYFRSFHLLYPIVEEPWLRAQLERLHAARKGEDVVAPVVWLVISLGASMIAGVKAREVSKRYLEQAWNSLATVMGSPYRSSVQALVLMAVAFRLVSG